MYNATARKLDADGKLVSTQAVTVNEDGLVIRASGFWTHKIGTAAHDAEWRGSQFSNVAKIEIDFDGGRGYAERLARIIPDTWVA